MSERRRLLGAGLIAAWSLIVIGVVWLRLSPLYEAWLVGGANILLPDDLWLGDFGPAITFNHASDGQSFRHGIDPLVLHSGMVIVLALVAATPGRSIRWRAQAAVAVAGGLFALQVAALAVFAFALRSSVSGGLLAGDALIGFAMFWASTPLVIGGAWAYRFWLPAFRLGAAREAE